MHNYQAKQALYERDLNQFKENEKQQHMKTNG